MMPLSVAALISGMMTLVATAPNLVVNAELMRHGATGFGFFRFTPFGVAALCIGIAYMLLARHWLVVREARVDAMPARPLLRDRITQYDLGSREHRGRLSQDSPLAGKRVGDLALRAAGINLLAIERRGRFRTDLIRPAAQTELERGDVLLVDVLDPGVEIAKLCEKYALEAMPLDQDTTYFTTGRRSSGWSR